MVLGILVMVPWGGFGGSEGGWIWCFGGPGAGFGGPGDGFGGPGGGFLTRKSNATAATETINQDHRTQSKTTGTTKQNEKHCLGLNF